MFSNFLRFLVRRAQKQNPEKMKIEFRNYSKKIVKVSFNFRFLKFKVYQKFNHYFQIYMDMIYNVNKIELGINDVLQLVEILLGEGKLISYSKPGLKIFIFS